MVDDPKDNSALTEQLIKVMHERDAMRPVVEAAIRHRFHVFLERIERTCSEEEIAVFRAVDVYRAQYPQYPAKQDPTPSVP